MRMGLRASSSTGRRRSMRSTRACSSRSPPRSKGCTKSQACASSCSQDAATLSAAARASAWGLVDELCAAAELDQAIGRLVQSLLAADARALRLQKELLELWHDAPLAASIDASLARFAEAYAGGVPAALRRHTISRA